MRAIFFTTQYKKDLKLALKRNLPEEKLNEVIKKLAQDIQLPEANLDHPLKGQYKGCRECHIQPDWLLIYSKEDRINLLSLVRTETHSDLFEK